MNVDGEGEGPVNVELPNLTEVAVTHCDCTTESGHGTVVLRMFTAGTLLWPEPTRSNLRVD